MTLTDKTAPSQTETISSEFELHHATEKVQNSGGARYGWKMMGGKLVDLLARIQ